MWFWASLYRSLPTFGTSGETLILVRCKIDSGVRIFALCNGVLNGIFIVLIAWLIIRVAIEYGNEWFWNSEENEGSMDEGTWWIFRIARWAFWGLGILSAIFTIAHIEMTVRWNDLAPDLDFTHPGQLIPLVIGMIVAIDGVLAVWTPGPQQKTHQSNNP